MTDADRIAALEAENAALKADVALLHAEIMALEEDETDLRNQVLNRDALIARQHAEILRLSIYAPGQHGEHKIRMAPHVGPTNWSAWGVDPLIDAEQ